MIAACFRRSSSCQRHSTALSNDSPSLPPSLSLSLSPLFLSRSHSCFHPQRSLTVAHPHHPYRPSSLVVSRCSLLPSPSSALSSAISTPLPLSSRDLLHSLDSQILQFQPCRRLARRRLGLRNDKFLAPSRRAASSPLPLPPPPIPPPYSFSHRRQPPLVFAGLRLSSFAQLIRLTGLLATSVTAFLLRHRPLSLKTASREWNERIKRE